MQDLAKFIDHTFLKAEGSYTQIQKLCDEAKEWSCFSVCVNPVYLSYCKEQLQNSSVKLCTVVGFPLGANTTETKIFETKQAIKLGADEIDMVISVGGLKSQKYDLVKTDIAKVVEAAQGKTVKVILETCLLTADEKKKACELSVAAGAHFVKTSTGMNQAGATVADIELMRACVGESVGVKASGGIRDLKTAQAMLAAGANRLGLSSTVEILKEATLS